VALSEIDRNLLSRCLDRKPRAWEDFVDRFMGLVVHVIDHSAESRLLRLTSADREDVASEVFLTLLADDMAVLRRFRGEASLATYLTVITRRVVVHQLLRRRQSVQPLDGVGISQAFVSTATSNGAAPEQAIQDRDEIARLLDELEGMEAEIVRMYHLEGKSYREISAAVGMPENSIGPTLSRARDKMRRTSVE
jgi:RNA polymerase sigma-70 factor, ECF subfamily